MEEKEAEEEYSFSRADYEAKREGLLKEEEDKPVQVISLTFIGENDDFKGACLVRAKGMFGAFEEALSKNLVPDAAIKYNIECYLLGVKESEVVPEEVLNKFFATHEEAEKNGRIAMKAIHDRFHGCNCELCRGEKDPEVLKARRNELVQKEIEADDPHVFWLSFVDTDKPEGDKFVGVCLIRCYGFFSAIELARLLGCNPGGQVKGVEIDNARGNLIPEECLGVLYPTREAVAELNKKLDPIFKAAGIFPERAEAKG